MLIVAGYFEVDPADQAAFVASKVDAINATRQENGCLEYCMSADPADASRVVLFERWADQAAFDAHMALVQSAPRTGGGPAPKGFKVEIYDIEGVRQFG